MNHIMNCCKQEDYVEPSLSSFIFFQVPRRAASLNSGDMFVLETPNLAYLWRGKVITAIPLQYCHRNIITTLLPQYYYNTVTAILLQHCYRNIVLHAGNI